MLVAQKFVDEWFNEMPLLYTTLCKSAAYAVLLGWLKTVEETAVGLWRGLSYKESIVVSIGHGTLTGTLVTMAMLAVVLIPFFAFTELSRVLGKEELGALLLSSHVVTDSLERAALANDEGAKIDRMREQPQRHS